MKARLWLPKRDRRDKPGDDDWDEWSKDPPALTIWKELSATAWRTLPSGTNNMSQCEISASDQSVTTDSATTRAAAAKAETNAAAAAAPLTPVAVDAPGIAPSDPSAGADAAVTIDLEPITSVTHWTSPNAQGGPKASSSWRPESKPGATARQWQAPRVPRLAADLQPRGDCPVHELRPEHRALADDGDDALDDGRPRRARPAEDGRDRGTEEQPAKIHPIACYTGSACGRPADRTSCAPSCERRGSGSRPP